MFPSWKLAGRSTEEVNVLLWSLMDLLELLLKETW